MKFTGKGKIEIPSEIENREFLIDEIKKHLTQDNF